MILDELLYKYKGITINAIRKAKNGEDINNEMDARQAIMEKIIKLDIEPEAVKECYNKEKINELDNELNEIIKYQLNNFKEELENSRTRKKAYSSYSRANMTNNIYSTRV